MGDAAKLRPPVAKRAPRRHVAHGRERVDPYAWLRDPAYPEVTDPEIRAYLEAENAYLESQLDPELRATLRKELEGRIAQNDDGVPYRKRGFWYWHRWEEGKQYPAHLRAPDVGGKPGAEVVLLDENVRAEGKDYLSIGALSVSPDDGRLAFSEDADGSERYVLRVLDLASGALLPDEVPNTAGSVVWSQDGAHVFYARLDAQLRPQAIVRHRLGTEAAEDVVLYEESDARMWLGLSKTSDERYLVVSSRDKESAEVSLLDLRTPEAGLTRVLARREGHLYDVDHHPRFGGAPRLLIRTNDRHRNYRLVTADPASLGQDDFEERWEEHLAPRDAVMFHGSVLFDGHLVHVEREDGLPQLTIERLADGDRRRVEVPEPVYDLAPGANVDLASKALRISYESLTTPRTVIDVDLESHAQQVRKVQRIPSGYDASLYEARRLFATAEDGTRIPISVVKRKDLGAGPDTPLYLYAYGAYGISIDAGFSTARPSLLDRGFVCAIAHVRGGGELGRAWYDAGKLENKENTFTDTLACARRLVEEGLTGPGRIALVGGSAGGMLVGATVNLDPELFGAGVAAVPFVDCLNTMMDASLPLTPTEYTEWGNPEADPEVYDRMAGYSPYDNLGPKPYPPMLVTAGLSDPRVTYWEPAKYVAKMRHERTSDGLLLLYTNMGAGHGGASGRFDRLAEVALQYAFVLEVLAEPQPTGSAWRRRRASSRRLASVARSAPKPASMSSTSSSASSASPSVGSKFPSFFSWRTPWTAPHSRSVRRRALPSSRAPAAAAAISRAAKPPMSARKGGRSEGSAFSLATSSRGSPRVSMRSLNSVGRLRGSVSYTPTVTRSSRSAASGEPGTAASRAALATTSRSRPSPSTTRRSSAVRIAALPSK